MPLPRWVAHANKRFTNRFVEPIVRWFPGFAFIHHHGRATGHDYRTPVTVFATEDGWIVALTYGPGADWAQNVLVRPGACERKKHPPRPMSHIRVVGRHEAWPHLPFLVRGALRVLRVRDFLAFDLDD